MTGYLVHTLFIGLGLVKDIVCNRIKTMMLFNNANNVDSTIVLLSTCRNNDEINDTESNDKNDSRRKEN